MAKGRKISQFIKQESVPSGSYFSFIYNGQNYAVSDSNFYAGLGVTGSIEQQGDVLGTPVLNQVSDTYYIRNLEAGSGINTYVSPEGGITIKHNFSQDDVGAALLGDISEDSPVFASLEAGFGIGISKEDDVITIEYTGEIPDTKTVYVNSTDDLPEIVSDLYDCEEDTTYIISNNVEVANGFRLKSGTSITGTSTIGPLLTYTGTDVMFVASEVTCLLQNLHYKCANGTAFDISDTSNTEIFSIINCQCEEAKYFGEFDSLFAINFANSNCLNNTETGPVLSGTGWGLISMDRFGLFTSNASYVGVDLGTCESDGIELSDLFASGPAGAVAITGAASSANITSGNFGAIEDCNFVGDITPISGIDVINDIRWNSNSNDTIPDSRTGALMSIESNATGTVITVAGTPVKMAGTWVDEGSSLFTVDATGKMTYTGEKDDSLNIDASVTVLAASGGEKAASAYLAINGSVVTATKKSGTVSDVDPASISMFWRHTFSQGDYVEIYLANEDNTINLIGEGGIGRISQ